MLQWIRLFLGAWEKIMCRDRCTISQDKELRITAYFERH
jgi:hypothetical protein